MTKLTKQALREAFDAIKNERPLGEMLVVHPSTLPWARVFMAWRHGIITASERDAAWRHLDILRHTGALS